MHDAAATETAFGSSGVLDTIRASGVINTTLLVDFRYGMPADEGEAPYGNRAAHRAAWSQLERLDGREVIALSDGEYNIATASLRALLDLPELPVIRDTEAETAQGSHSVSSIEALARLDRLRLGQPDPAMMLALSRNAEKALKYLTKRFRQKQSVVRLIAGDMGEGKTTLAQEIYSAGTMAGATPIMFSVPRVKTFNPPDWLRSMLIDQDLLTAAIQNISQTSLLVDDNQARILCNSFQTPPLSTVMATVIQQAVTHAEQYSDPDEARVLASDCQRGLAPWLSSGYSYIKPGQAFLREYGCVKAFSGRYQAAMIPAIISEFLTFYREAGIYPIWEFDEFESISQLAPQRLDIALGFFRDILDGVMNTGSGALFLFCTGDGVNAIRRYPALADRLKSPDNWTLASPTWQAHRFCKWDALAVFDALFGLYHAGSEVGDPASEAVVEHEAELREIFSDPDMQDSVEDASVVPRERLKALVALFDSTIDGSDALAGYLDALQAPPPSLPSTEQPDEPLLDTMTASINAMYLTESEAGEADQQEAASCNEHDASNAIKLAEMDDGFPPLDVDEGGDAISAALSAAGISCDTGVEPEPHAGSHSETKGASSEEENAGTNDLKKPAQPDAEQLKEMLTPAGRLRLGTRTELAASIMPFQHAHYPSGSFDVNDQQATIHKASDCARLGLRISQFRDGGGLMRDFWQTFSEDTLQLTQDKRVVLLEDSANDLQEMERLGSELLELVDGHGGRLPVALPETTVAAEYREALEIDDRNSIRAAREDGNEVWSFLRDKVRWPGFRTPGWASPLQDVQVFRQALYTWFAFHLQVPSDEWVDQFVLTTLKERFAYEPRTSRGGVQFVLPRHGLLSRFDKRRNIAVEPIEKK